MKKFPKRGDIFWVRLDPTFGSEMQKTRPAIIISNDNGNELSPRVIIAPITSKIGKVYPFEVEIQVNDKRGKIVLDQIRSIDKMRLIKRIDVCDYDTMELVEEALKLVLSLT